MYYWILAKPSPLTFITNNLYMSRVHYTRNIWLWLIKRVSSFSINRTKREKIKTLVLGNVTLSFILISLDKESLDYILENVILLSKQFNTMCIHWCVNVYVSIPRVNNLFPMLKYLESIVITSNLQKYM